MKNTINKFQIQYFIFVVMILGLVFVQSYSAEAVSSTGESNAFSVYTINSLADINRGLSLYGGDYVKIPNTLSLTEFSDQITLEMWVKCDSFSPVYTTFLHKQGGNNNDAWVGVETSKLKIILRIDGVEKGWILDNPLSLDVWYHVAAVYDSGACKVYLNGKEIDSKSYSGKLTFDDKDWFIGVDTDSGGTVFNDYLDGLIDEVRIWNVARTQEQIKATMKTTLQGNEDGLVAYFPFNNGTAFDSSQHSGNHGMFMGDAEIVTLYEPWPPTKIGDVSGNDEITAYDVS